MCCKNDLLIWAFFFFFFLIVLGIRRVGRRPDQQLQGEGKIIDRRPERRPPRERRFEKPLEEKGEGGEFSVDRQDCFLISSYIVSL